MSVRAAVSSAQDFIQAAVPSKRDGSNSGSESDFKDVLTSLKGVKRPASSRPGAEKNFLNGAIAIGELPVELTSLLPDPVAQTEPPADVPLPEGEQPPSRFDPDVILGGIIGEISSEQKCDDESPDAAASDAPEADAPEEQKLPDMPMPASADETADLSQSAIPVSAPELTEPEEKLSDVAKADVASPRNATAQKNMASAVQADAPAQNTEAFRAALGQSDVEDPERDEKNPDAPGEETAGSNVRERGAKLPEGERQISDARREPPRHREMAARHAASHSEQGAASPAPGRDDEPGGHPSPVNIFGLSGGGESRAAASAPVSHPAATYTLASGDKFGEGLLTVVEMMTGPESSEVRIIVEPPALGRVDVSLRASSAGVEAMFRVDNEELRQMVQNQLDSLKASLQAQGIHVSGLSVDIRNGDAGEGRGNPRGAKGKRARNVRDGSGGVEDEARVVRLDLEKGLLHWVA
jgi:flagellar hook-length control protein FliK